MPFLDVSDLLADPDFAESLTCVRRDQSVGADGMAGVTTSDIPFIGVVTSNEGAVLDVVAQGQRIEGSITVHTRFRLRDGGAGAAPDHVLRGGREYIVDAIHDYSRYGAGFVAADCRIKPLSG